MTDSDERPEMWRPVAPMDGCTFSGYEVSDKGRARSIDRRQGNRQLQGKVLAAKPHEDGYVLTTIRCDSTEPGHKRAHTYAMHKVVLTTFDRPCPPGMECCHSKRGPAFNWWPEGIRWGTKPENAADKPEPSVLDATYPCRNAPACTNMVVNQGRRCLDCVAEVGRQAADMRRAGRSWQEVAAHFGNSEDWIRKLARKYGGYEDSEVPHRPCACAACAASSQRSRGVLGRLAVTLRVARRSAEAR